MSQGDIEIYSEDAGQGVEVYSREVNHIVAEVEFRDAECEDVVEGMGCVFCLAGWVFLEQGQNLLHFIIGEILPYGLP